MDGFKIFIHKRLPPSMNPPSRPTRFRAPVRHYHRHNPKSDPSWDAWVGADSKPKSRFLIPLVSIVALFIVSALLVIGYALITK